MHSKKASKEIDGGKGNAFPKRVGRKGVNRKREKKGSRKAWSKQGLWGETRPKGNKGFFV